MAYNNDINERDTILNAKKYLQILEKIEKDRDCSKDDFSWLKTNSAFIDNNIRNRLLNRYSTKEPTLYLNDEKYIKLLTNQNILQNFADQIFGFSEGFNLRSIKLIPEAKEFIKDYLLEAGEKHGLVEQAISTNEVFIVHGKNNEMKESVARLCEKLRLKPIILHEQLNRGKTIIEKLEKHSGVGFAIILLSPDDKGYQRDHDPASAKLRARQNVIFEFGFFAGKIGRENVAALYLEDKNFEMPTDLSGFIYIPYDRRDAWRYRLINELKSSGYDVSKEDI